MTPRSEVIADALADRTHAALAVPGNQYAGWRAIESGPRFSFSTRAEAISWLEQLVGSPANTPVSMLLRQAALRAHPDRYAGDRTLWNKGRRGPASCSSDRSQDD